VAPPASQSPSFYFAHGKHDIHSSALRDAQHDARGFIGIKPDSTDRKIVRSRWNCGEQIIAAGVGTIAFLAIISKSTACGKRICACSLTT
jgi:hypothetical protein